MTKSQFLAKKSNELIQLVSNKEEDLLPEDEKEKLRKFCSDFLESLITIKNNKNGNK